MKKEDYYIFLIEYALYRLKERPEVIEEGGVFTFPDGTGVVLDYDFYKEIMDYVKRKFCGE